ncbi:MAG TPA: M1 family metallopeptidase [Chitinophagaceae bacterium]|nr:M1 family metallopeptidase [Chitinophagaceae bacterium]
MRNNLIILAVSLLSFQLCWSQPDRWQQSVKYHMDVHMDVKTNQFTGKQKLQYSNNSPDTLYRVFYHLYFNAFQPNSMMDVRSRELGKIQIGRGQDWDSRVRDRIEHLQPDEIGYQKIKSLSMNGVSQPYVVRETILEVDLKKPILPHTTVVFDMEFEGQVPLQVRRSGRDNPNTGVRYSMSQWYPKMCEYDYEGWHPTPYVAREFYGVWGDYEVNITIDRHYVLGGTGYLQNASQIGYGYEAPGTKVQRPATAELTWKFIAPNVHDFMWAADPDYVHLVRRVSNGRVINVLYKNKPGDKANDAAWNKLADAAVTVLPYIEKRFGPYPYKQYSFIQGGDGGMEYPMGTLIYSSSLGTAFHEWMHTWYQMMLGTNESEYPWMDEGFTDWAAQLVSEYYREQVIRPELAASNPEGLKRSDSVAARLPLYHAGSYDAYYYLAQSGYEEPMSTHADHFNTNFAYGLASYSKGAVFMEQLGYIVGAQVRDRILQEYYRLWRFKHPNASDFIRVAEKVSHMKLDWYKEYWIYTTKTIDYGIDSLWEVGGKTRIRLKRIGQMPMPIDLQLEFKDGSRQLCYVPLYSMFGEKPVEDTAIPRTVYEPWKWTHPTYTLEVDRKITDIKALEIDPTRRMADVERRNNRLEIPW